MAVIAVLPVAVDPLTMMLIYSSFAQYDVIVITRIRFPSKYLIKNDKTNMDLAADRRIIGIAGRRPTVERLAVRRIERAAAAEANR